MNPVGAFMDADPQTAVGVVKEMKASGKGIIGMKILGQGEMRNRQDEALKFALSLGLLDAFTIGAESKAEQEAFISKTDGCLTRLKSETEKALDPYPSTPSLLPAVGPTVLPC